MLSGRVVSAFRGARSAAIFSRNSGYLCAMLAAFRSRHLGGHPSNTALTRVMPLPVRPRADCNRLDSGSYVQTIGTSGAVSGKRPPGRYHSTV